MFKNFVHNSNRRLHLLATITFLVAAAMQFISDNVKAQSKQGSSKIDQSKLYYDKNFFIENKGQWPGEVMFMAKMNGMNAWITKEKIVYDFFDLNVSNSTQGRKVKQPYNRNRHVIVNTNLNINESAHVEGLKKGQCYYNYLMTVGHNASNVATYKEVLCHNMVDGIDKRYYFSENSLRYDYIVQANANPNDIQMKIEGSDQVYVDDKGALTYSTIFGEVKETKLVCYQGEGISKKVIPSKFVINSEGRIGFIIGEYDRNKTLVIDPLLYSTFIGGTNGDWGTAIKVNSNGNAFITGHTIGVSFPSNPGPQLLGNLGSTDGFVVELSADGSQAIFNTIIGGIRDEGFNAIDLFSNGNIVVVGHQTEGFFPTSLNVIPPLYNPQGAQDALAVVLSPGGNQLIFSTYIGTVASDYGSGVKVNPLSPTNSFWITGNTELGGSFPTSALNPILGTVGWSDGFLTRIDLDLIQNTATNAWSRILATAEPDDAASIDVNQAGDVFIGGSTKGLSSGTTFTFPGTWIGSSSTNNFNCFITQIHPATAPYIVNSRIFGSTGADDVIRGIKVSSLGSATNNLSYGQIFATGSSSGTNFPNAVNSNFGTSDCILIRMDPGFGTLQSRYLGGVNDDIGYGIALASSFSPITQNINFIEYPCVTGFTFSGAGQGGMANAYPPESFPQLPCNGPTLAMGGDVFVTTFQNNLALPFTYSELFGGDNEEQGYAIDLTSDGTIYITGVTASSGFPIYAAPPLTAWDPNFNLGGGINDRDGFAMAITKPAYPPLLITTTTPTVYCGASAVLTANPTTYASYDWEPGSLTGNPVTISPNVTTTYTCTATDACSNTFTTTVTITLNNNGYCCAPQIIANGATPLDNTNSMGMSSSITGVTYFVNGTFTILSPMTFDNCTFYFTANAKIVYTAAAGNLTFNDCVFQSPDSPCEMWDGIYASTGMNMNFTNCTLRDMTNGVVISSLAKLTATGSTFEDNWISIQLNNLPSTYSGIVENCTFNSPNGLKAPILGWLPRTGISIANSFTVTIGNPTNSGLGNVFDNLQNGISIQYISSSVFSNGAYTTNLNFNRFSNIVGGANVWNLGSAFYDNSVGCAIWGQYISKGYKGSPTINVKGNLIAGGPIMNFDHCNKDVILNGFGATVTNNNSNACDVGIVLNKADSRIFSIIGNNLNNVILGIHKIGNEMSYTNPSQFGFIASDNFMTLAPYPVTNPGISTGIRSEYVTSNTGNSFIYHNYIYLPMEKDAYAISLESGAKDKIVENNFFYTTSGSTALEIQPTLRGINVLNSTSTTISKNTCTGQANNFLNSVNATGIFIGGGNSQFADISCNVVNNLQYGIFTEGDQTTGFDKVKGNTLTTQRCGLCFIHSNSMEGTFGDIGINMLSTPFTKFDANNHVYGNNQLRRVYRFTPNNSPTASYTLNNIYTQSSNLSDVLNDSWSGNSLTINTPNGVNRYKIQNLSSFTDIFSISSCSGISNISGTSDPFYELALRIANENTEYLDYNEEASWLDERMLMEWLVEDPTLLVDYPLLTSFYLEENNSILNELAEVERSINLLSTESLLNNQTQWETTWQQTNSNNEALDVSEYFAQNEQFINRQYLWLLKNEIDSMAQTDKDEILALAASCPYVSGRGVYRARTLANMLTPNIHYDDKTICNAIGAYKNGVDPYSEAMDILNGNILANIRVYPNPASTTLFIEHELTNNESANFTLYDMLGNIILKRVINGGKEKQAQIDISNLSSGVYTYKLLSGKHISKARKLIVE